MSGFIALYHRGGRPLDGILLERLTAALSWRGGDGWGTWHGEDVGLGRALFRTSAEDEPAGPLSLEGCHCVGDVRLDDRQPLIARLRAAGCRVQDATPDIELLVRSYCRWGEECLSRLTGDFSFALWDEHRRRLVAARDQFGVSPLFFAELGELLVVGNSLRGLLDHPEIDDAVDQDSIADFLAVGTPQSRQATFYRSIRRLEGGRSLTADASGVRLHTYWTMPENKRVVRYRRPADYVREFRDVFDRAVSDRLRGSRVSTHLSGGMDASSIAATLACQMGVADLRAFTYYFESLLPDNEGPLSQTIAAKCGIPLELLPIEPCYERTAEQRDSIGAPEPLWLPDHSPLRELNRRAAAHGRILFQGFGGDPLFDQRYDPCPPLGLTELAHGLCDLAYGRMAYWRVPRPSLRPRRWHSRAARGYEVSRDVVLNADFALRQGIEDRRRRCLSSPPPPARRGMGHDPLWARIFEQATPDFTGQPLKAVFPFFDLRIVDFLDQVPPFPWLHNKALLRMAMYDRLPAEIIVRHKTGLQGNPRLNHIRKHGAAPWMFDLLKVDGLGQYVNLQASANLLDEPQNLGRSQLFHLEAVLSLAYWLRDRTVARRASSGCRGDDAGTL